jgi:hypothetical protein
MCYIPTSAITHENQHQCRNKHGDVYVNIGASGGGREIYGAVGCVEVHIRAVVCEDRDSDRGGYRRAEVSKDCVEPRAAPRRCLDTNVLFVPPEELLELEEELLEELELSYFSIFTPPLSYVFVTVLPLLPAVMVLTASP